MRLRSPLLSRGVRLAALLLAIEFLDELVFGAREAAWPLIRTDLGLSYTQVGLLLSVPGLVSTLVEPVLGILADTWKRRVLILGGGIVFALALVLTAQSGRFALLMLSFVLLYPASGAFVSLSQATLMDSDPQRHEQNMACWTLAGSVGVVAGPLALTAAAALGAGWRGLFLGSALLALLLVALAARVPFVQRQTCEQPSGLGAGIANAGRALQRREVWRWLTLLQFSDLLLDVLLGFIALYWVDVVGATPTQAGLAVAVWAGCGLVGDALLIPLLERVRGLAYLRWSALAESLLFVGLLLLPSVGAKLVLLGLLGLLNAGWYSILQAQLYSAMPGQSGTVVAIGNVAGLAASLIPLGLGALAERVGLGATMWALVAGPLALLVGLPRRKK